MARRNVFIKSDSIDKKFDDVERTLQLMSTKLFKTATVVIPPIPLSFALESIPTDGEVFRAFFSVDGHISRMDIFCDSIEKGAVATITVSVLGDIKKSVSVDLKKGLSSFPMEIGLPKGSKIIITVDGDREKVTGLWACALYETHMGSVAIEPLVIDDIFVNREGLLEDVTEKEEPAAT